MGEALRVEPSSGGGVEGLVRVVEGCVDVVEGCVDVVEGCVDVVGVLVESWRGV